MEGRNIKTKATVPQQVKRILLRTFIIFSNTNSCTIYFATTTSIWLLFLRYFSTFKTDLCDDVFVSNCVLFHSENGAWRDSERLNNFLLPWLRRDFFLFDAVSTFTRTVFLFFYISLAWDVLFHLVAASFQVFTQN